MPTQLQFRSSPLRHGQVAGRFIASLERVTAMIMATVVAVAATTGVASAADYPDQPIKIIIPFAAGGGNDAIGRTVGKLLSQSLGVPVVVENMDGAGGKIGVGKGLAARPDGYTLTLISNSYAVNASLYNLAFDPVTDLTPIGMIARGPLLITTPASLPVASLAELVALARSKGTLSYASSGVGGISHLATELFLMKAGVKMAHIPYRGTSPAMLDTMAGRTEVFFSTPGAALPYIKDGRLRAIAQTLPGPWPDMPSVPSVQLAGIPDYQVVVWYGLIAPKGLPRQVQQRLNAALNDAIGQPEVTRQIASEGNLASSGTPDQLLKQIKDEIGIWRDVVSKAHISVN